MTSQPTLKKKWRMILLILILCLIGIQFIRPSLDSQPVTGDFTAPQEVKKIIERACYDCHSNKTNLAWFDQLEPAYWLVRADILEARKVLNFSAWDSLPADQQKGKLFEALNHIEFKEMPLKQYVLLHPGAKVSSSDITVLKNYLDTLAPVNISNPARMVAADTQYRKWIGTMGPDNSAAGPQSVKPSPNGIPYNPEYKNWEAISTTDRFDNGTLRVITGNETAVKAIKEHHTNPWPNGTQFAKIAWKAVLDSTGMVHAGEFLQVEFMIKDNEKYAATEGWGWGRWKGTQLKPYGANALFTTECTSCHRPLHDNDFVFTSPLPDTLSFNSLEWKVVTSSQNKNDKTMSTLYGNNIAIESARKGTPYAAGASLAMVTWSQKADEHWFGARIPAMVQSIEEVRFNTTGVDNTIFPAYKKYTGQPLRKSGADDPEKAKNRIAYIAGQKASVMP